MQVSGQVNHIPPFYHHNPAQFVTATNLGLFGSRNIDMNQEVKSEKKIKSEVKPKLEKIECQVCNQKIAGNGNFRKHMMTKHGTDRQKVDEEIDLIRKNSTTCHGCGKIFKQPYRLKGHQSGLRNCNFCDKKFPCQQGLVNHNASFHSAPVNTSINNKELLEEEVPPQLEEQRPVTRMEEKSLHQQIMDAFMEVDDVMQKIKTIINN